jgi:serine/threonine protein kinase
VMGQLNHPSVVTLFSFGRTRGVPWLAMRLLEGSDLWETLAKAGGRMTPAQLLPIVRQILGALAYLHGRDLLHRDLKPSNIHVGKTGKVTLCDFGLARGHKSSLTRTGVIWGTPEYMAPEQILGERDLDGRADLYALGVVMYRMLAGQPVFAEENEQDLLRAHLSRPRPDVARLVPTLSPMIGAAMQKALAIHPEDRFQSADEMLQALELVLALPPVPPRAVAGPPIAPQPPKRFEGTRPAVKAVPSPDDDDDASSTRPEGFGALQDASSASTSPEGFTAVSLSVTPVEENLTQPVAAVVTEPERELLLARGADSGRTVSERPRIARVPPPTSVEGLPVHREDDAASLPTPATPVDAAPRPPAATPRGKPLLPLPVLIIGALLLFLFGVLAAKLIR